MPEGDTIHRIAGRLREGLAGRPVERVYVQAHGDIAELKGATVTDVEARGKHMLVHFDGGWSLRVHLGMKGKWGRRPSTDRLSKTTAARLDAAPWAFVCRNAYQTEMLKTAHLTAHPRLRRLGPDLLGDPPDIVAMTKRAMLAGHAQREIGDLIMDQGVAAGLGNVYKSEVLFLRRLHPRAKAHALSRETWTEVFACAHELMYANLNTKRRETVPRQRRPTPGSPRFWVYRRHLEPCLECGTSVDRIRQGSQLRSTYFCPSCQSQSETA